MAVIKAEANQELKKQLKDMAKKLGESESTLVRRAIRNMISQEKPIATRS